MDYYLQNTLARRLDLEMVTTIYLSDRPVMFNFIGEQFDHLWWTGGRPLTLSQALSG